MSKPWGRFFQILCASQKVRTLPYFVNVVLECPLIHIACLLLRTSYYTFELCSVKMAYFFLLKKKINALDISNAFTKMKKEMLFVSALMWKNLSSTKDGISKFCPKSMKYFLIHNCWDMIQYARIPYSCHYNVLHSFNLLYCIVI